MVAVSKKTLWRRWWFWPLAVFLYVLTAIPLGLLAYTLKTEMGWNIFRRTGYHDYLRCLQREAHKVEFEMPQRQAPSTTLP